MKNEDDLSPPEFEGNSNPHIRITLKHQFFETEAEADNARRQEIERLHREATGDTTDLGDMLNLAKDVAARNGIPYQQPQSFTHTFNLNGNFHTAEIGVN